MNAQNPPPKAVPFTFDRAFDREGAGKSAPAAPKRKMMDLAEIEAIRREAHEAGRREGEASAARRQADALNVLSLRIETLAANLGEAIVPAQTEAVTLAYVIALKLSRVLLREKPRAEIEALIAQCVEEHKSEPHIVVRVNDTLHDEVKEMAQKLAATRGYSGRIHIIGEPDIVEGDCTIEWADGGLERRIDNAIAEIDGIVRGYITAAGGGIHPPSAAQILNPVGEAQ